MIEMLRQRLSVGTSCDHCRVKYSRGKAYKSRCRNRKRRDGTGENGRYNSRTEALGKVRLVEEYGKPAAALDAAIERWRAARSRSRQHPSPWR
jgi:hypothetical protein